MRSAARWSTSFPSRAATLGSLGEKLSDYRGLKEAGAVALSDDGKPILDDHIMREALALAAKVGLPVIQHAEDTKISHGNPMNEGVTSFKLGLRGQPAASEWQMVERDIRLASQEGGRLHVAHVSTAKSLDMVRLGRASQVKVTAEVTPHHFLFTEENCSTYDTRYKMNPPLRSAADREAMLAALIDGTIDAIATDHAPHALFEKEVEFDKAAFGITGLEIALAATITELQHTGKISLSARGGVALDQSGEDRGAERPRHAGRRLGGRRYHLRSEKTLDLRRAEDALALAQLSRTTECSSTARCGRRLWPARLSSANCRHRCRARSGLQGVHARPAEQAGLLLLEWNFQPCAMLIPS